MKRALFIIFMAQLWAGAAFAQGARPAEWEKIVEAGRREGKVVASIPPSAELRRLMEVELPASADEIARARSHGDLSENYEYKAAKEKQARLMSRINRLRADLAHARPIVPTEVDLAHISVGCRVELIDATGTKLVYSLLGPWDSNPEQGVISYQSPLAQSLIGRKQGDTVEMDGRVFTITAIGPGVSF